MSGNVLFNAILPNLIPLSSEFNGVKAILRCKGVIATITMTHDDSYIYIALTATHIHMPFIDMIMWRLELLL